MAAAAGAWVRFLDGVGRVLPRKLQPVWNHEAGPRTVFFWAPTMKWGLVIAGLADLLRPADKLSAAQSGVLTATGTVWSRYSLVITPVNYNLFAVNLFLAFAGGTQLFRIWRFDQEQKAKAKQED
ncbi:mitochondrial pyruvate carrier 2 [Petromyzon marinus]|uniref:Mitochondrial pyruvate carrier n=1 Tax=Petromyzon marinus TaxID=7757 RepID=A0AAJ7XJ56_PETMA|nr:mitochondrial pyruvate carrier 2 [Petromyzon marinus]